MAKHARLAGSCILTVVGCLLAACSGGSSGGSSSPTVGSPTTQATLASGGAIGSGSTTPTAAASAGTTGLDSTSPATNPSTGASAPAIVVCTVLPITQVAALSGVALTTSREQDFAEGNAYTCNYFPASGVGGLSVTVTAVGGAQAYANSLQTDTIAGAAEHVAPLTGVGDEAFSAQDGVRATFGDRMIYVAGLTSNQPAVAIIQALQAQLG
jgi:hypothetical protein